MKPIRIAIIVFAFVMTTGWKLAAEQSGAYHQTKDVVYGQTPYGTTLAMDIFTPTGDANGLGLIDVASGAWNSDRGKIRDHDLAGMFRVHCAKGYTVFAVRPGSSSKYSGREMLANVKRGIRWVKVHADEYGIDPDRLGLTGASAGGHLASLAAVTAEAGNPEAKDPLDRMSTDVKACAVFFPPTDFVEWGTSAIRRLGGALFFDGSDPNRGSMDGKTDEEIREAAIAVSPTLLVTADAPPFLIFHGTADPLVPLEQSKLLIAALKKAGVAAELVIKEGGAHPWPTIAEEVAQMAEWFDAQLAK